ncbi:hypothetical protein H6P81_010897 [Aristolochia fimbriata]|uniref:Uncharacterized protein n=1 Tax=Aristolochia fimbriata TaxID=158543 RepID=A0AAV7ETG6_ARIFI|nr:hypothetical protein H6P81_010897 [Aristolochia fimbriata]
MGGGGGGDDGRSGDIGRGRCICPSPLSKFNREYKTAFTCSEEFFCMDSSRIYNNHPSESMYVDVKEGDWVLEIGIREAVRSPRLSSTALNM